MKIRFELLETKNDLFPVFQNNQKYQMKINLEREYDEDEKTMFNVGCTAEIDFCPEVVTYPLVFKALVQVMEDFYGYKFKKDQIVAQLEDS